MTGPAEVRCVCGHPDWEHIPVAGSDPDGDLDVCSECDCEHLRVDQPGDQPGEREQPW